MEKTKRKNPDNIRPYWYVFLPLMIVLAIMVYFPLRIALDELLLDTIFYGAIMLTCIMSAIHVNRRFHKQGRRLVVVILLCVFLSGWQVFDLIILRTGGQSGWIDKIHYGLRFPDDTIYGCNSVSERFIGYRYIGNGLIAIAYDINWKDSWPNCGG